MEQQQGKAPRRELDLEMDRLEANIEKVRVLYEQYFIDILPLPPEKEHQEINRHVRSLLKAPFKNSQSRFRLRQIIQRFQTYATYWERILKQREDGVYHKDLFKAEMRGKSVSNLKNSTAPQSKSEKGLQDLFSTYANALKQNGTANQQLDFDKFKHTMIERAKAIKASHGVKKVKYSVVTKDGKVVIKATAAE